MLVKITKTKSSDMTPGSNQEICFGVARQGAHIFILKLKIVKALKIFS